MKVVILRSMYLHIGSCNHKMKHVFYLKSTKILFVLILIKRRNDHVPSLTKSWYNTVCIFWCWIVNLGIEHGTCQVKKYKYSWNCYEGFTGQSCDVDIDECRFITFERRNLQQLHLWLWKRLLRTILWDLWLLWHKSFITY